MFMLCTKKCKIFVHPTDLHFRYQNCTHGSLKRQEAILFKSKSRSSLFVQLKSSGHYMHRLWSLYVPHSSHYMYRTAVTICTACGHCMYRLRSLCTASLTFSNSAFCPHTVFMCFVWISEQTAIISLYSVNWLVCITETESV